MIKHATFVIADLTLGVESPRQENPSRAHEIGMAIAYERPLMLSSQEPRRYPYFSIGDLQMTFWDTEDELQRQTRDWVRAHAEGVARRVFNHELPVATVAPAAFAYDGKRRYIGPNTRRAPEERWTNRALRAGAIAVSAAILLVLAWCPMVSPDCVDRLDNALLTPAQILLRGANLYLCAPRGQLTEGFLAIAPYRCIGCLAMLPPDWYAELAQMERVVAGFYERAYGVTSATFYEQGRAGGGASPEQAGGFPLHAHLCCLPLPPDVDGLLRKYRRKHIAGWHELVAAADGGPYVYVEGRGVASRRSRGRSTSQAASEDRAALECVRLKPAIAAVMGVPERGYRRDYPGDEELDRLIPKFSQFIERRSQ